MSAGELLPENKLIRSEFVPVSNQSGRFGNSGHSAVNEMGPTLFRLKVETEELDADDARVWKNWLLRRNGRAVTFTAWDLWYINPKRSLGTPDGAIGLTVSIATKELLLSGVGAYQASVGDPISYRTAANGFWHGYIQADVNAAADLITLPVLPRPVAKHATTPAVRRVKALAEFELTTDPDGLEPYSGRTLSFEAMQVPR